MSNGVIIILPAESFPVETGCYMDILSGKLSGIEDNSL